MIRDPITGKGMLNGYNEKGHYNWKRNVELVLRKGTL